MIDMATVISKPLSFFKEDPTNLRLSYDFEDLRLLAASLIKKQLVPLICRPCGTIIDGHRRFRSAMLDGKPEYLDTIIVDANASPAQIKEIQLITALHHAGLKPYEQFCGFLAWLRANPGKGGKDLAAALDRSEASVSMTLSLSRCVKAVQEAAAAGKLGMKDWHAMSQVDEQQQLVMLEAKLNGTSAEGLKRLRKKPASAVRTARVKCAMPSGVMVTLAGEGGGLTLDDVIQTLSELLKAAKAAHVQGLDSKTFSAVMRDKSRLGG